jgi:NADPH-dependent F420 reductase
MAPDERVDVAGLRVGVLGGTGPQGRGLALRLAMAGQDVVVGSRDAGRARAVADELGNGVRGLDNAGCAAAADVVVVAVPWEGHAQLLETMADLVTGKLVVDSVNPLGFDERGAFALRVDDGSATEQAARLLPGATVVGAFHHISAVQLLDLSLDRIDTDVMVVGDDRSATDSVQALAERIPGVRGVYCGRLRSAHQVEALTANLISVNRRYRAHAGIRVTDIGALP